MKKLILVVAIFVFFYCVFPVFLMGGWLFAWNYRKALTINNNSNSNSLTDYQVLTTLNTQSLISSGKMRSDCGDVRFTDSDGQTQLNYWIESGCNTSSTKIWVKVPSIPASSTKTIYVYYGNPSATSASNGDNTFLLFDDFLGTSLNTNKWTVGVQNTYMSYSVGNGILTLSSSKSASDYTWYSIRIQSVATNFSLPLAIRALTRFYAPSDSEYWGGLKGKFGYKYISFSSDPSLDGGGFYYRNSNYQAGAIVGSDSELLNYTTNSYSFGTWYISEVKITTDQINAYLNDSLKGSFSYSLPSPQPISMGLTIGDLSAGYNPSLQKIEFDWILVRKFTSSEPTTSVGVEEFGMLFFLLFE